MDIKKASLNEVDDIVNISMNDGYNHPLDKESVRTYISNGDNYFLAYEHGEPVGVVKICLNKDSEAEIFILSVVREFQGKGIAQKLMAIAYSWAKENNFNSVCLFVEATNKKAIKFYEKEGFSEVSKVFDLYKKGNIHLKMEKVLDL